VSLVAHVGAKLLEHETHKEMVQRLAGTSFKRKVAWDLQVRRAPTLHATLFGDVEPSDRERVNVRELLSGAPTLRPVIHGPFVGSFNRGRIYLPLVFDRREDRDLLMLLGGALARPANQFVAVGVANLCDELDPEEALELAALMDSMQGPRSRLHVDIISWTSTHNDLTLDSEQLESFPLQN
jgi:hypothetical protein